MSTFNTSVMIEIGTDGKIKETKMKFDDGLDIKFNVIQTFTELAPVDDPKTVYMIAETVIGMKYLVEKHTFDSVDDARAALNLMALAHRCKTCISMECFENNEEREIQKSDKKRKRKK